jgi:hypothetical protein
LALSVKLKNASEKPASDKASKRFDPPRTIWLSDGSAVQSRRKIQRIQSDRFVRHDSFGNGHRAIGDLGKYGKTG